MDGASTFFVVSEHTAAYNQAPYFIQVYINSLIYKCFDNFTYTCTLKQQLTRKHFAPKSI